MRSRAARSLPTSLAFSYWANEPAIWRIIVRLGSSLAVRSSPDAVSSRTSRLISRVMPNSCTINSRAKRLASSMMTVRTPLPSMRSRSPAKPLRPSMGSAPLTASS